MADSRFIGTGVALITPFQKDFTIDFAALKRVVEYCIKGKVNYIVVLGTTGEPATLNSKEKKEVFKYVAEIVGKRVPLVAGIGGNNTSEVIDNIREADIAAYDAILSVVPYYSKPNQQGIFEHYKAIVTQSKLPIIMYNVPGRTGVNMTSATTVKLAKEFPNIIAVKEASGNMVQIMEILRDKPENFMVISGDDSLTLPMISLGAEGVISVIANGLPLEFSTLVEEALGNNFQLARRMQGSLLEVMVEIFTEGSPAGVKAILHQKGLIENVVRLPLTAVSQPHYLKLKNSIGQ